MRHGIVSTAVLVLALTVGSWIVGFAPDDQVEPASASAAVVLTPAEPEPSTTTALDVTTSSGPPNLSAEPIGETVPSTTAPPTVDAADQFLGELNSLRDQAGLELLTRRTALDDLAQGWAEMMAADGSLRHSALIYDVIAGTWTTAGENVGYGPSAPVVFAALERSPGHLANMVNPDFNSVGIGIVRAGGVLWTAHLFAG